MLIKPFDKTNNTYHSVLDNVSLHSLKVISKANYSTNLENTFEIFEITFFIQKIPQINKKKSYHI